MEAEKQQIVVGGDIVDMSLGISTTNTVYTLGQTHQVIEAQSLPPEFYAALPPDFVAQLRGSDAGGEGVCRVSASVEFPPRSSMARSRSASMNA